MENGPGVKAILLFAVYLERGKIVDQFSLLSLMKSKKAFDELDDTLCCVILQ